MGGLDQVFVFVPAKARFERATLVRATPRPGVAEPKRGQQAQRGGCRAAVDHGDANENVIRRPLGVFRENIEITVVIKHARVREFEFGIVLATAAVLLEQPRVRKFRLRIFVERLQVGMRRRRIEVEVLFFHVFAVISLAAREAEQTLLENRVPAVPQRERETEPALAVGDAEQTVLAPAVRAAAGVVVREEIPTGASFGVVLAHGGPLTFAQVWTPTFPVFHASGVLLQTD